MRSHCYVVAWGQRTFRASRQCDKQGAGVRENPRIGLSVNVQPPRLRTRNVKRTFGPVWPHVSGHAITLDEASSQFKQSYEVMRTKAGLPRPQR